MLGEEIFPFGSVCESWMHWVKKFSICEDFSSVYMCIYRAGCRESYWVRKFSICEVFSSVYALVRAGGIESYWVRKIFQDFSSVSDVHL